MALSARISLLVFSFGCHRIALLLHSWHLQMNWLNSLKPPLKLFPRVLRTSWQKWYLLLLITVWMFVRLFSRFFWPRLFSCSDICFQLFVQLVVSVPVKLSFVILLSLQNGSKWCNPAAPTVINFSLFHFFGEKSPSNSAHGFGLCAVDNQIFFVGFTSSPANCCTIDVRDACRFCSLSQTGFLFLMPTTRQYSCCCLLGNGNDIVVAGGKNAKALDVVETFSIKQQSWRTLPHMITARSSCCGVSFSRSEGPVREGIYIFAG